MGAEEATAVSRFAGLNAEDRRAVEANAERVRRNVPLEERADRTGVIYDVALFMLGVPVWDEQVGFAFQLMAWARENQ